MPMNDNSQGRSADGASEGAETDRRCTTCGKSVAAEEIPYECWLFSTCPSCAVEPAPDRWSRTGTARKWRYNPRWHQNISNALSRTERDAWSGLVDVADQLQTAADAQSNARLEGRLLLALDNVIDAIRLVEEYGNEHGQDRRAEREAAMDTNSESQTDG